MNKSLPESQKELMKIFWIESRAAYKGVKRGKAGTIWEVQIIPFAKV